METLSQAQIETARIVGNEAISLLAKKHNTTEELVRMAYLAGQKEVVKQMEQLIAIGFEQVKQVW